MAYRDIKDQTARIAAQVSISEKVAHVRKALNLDPLHHCHWPGCDKKVKPALWGCTKHWYSLPIDLRSRIWRTYVPGQENSKDPSAAYLEVARAVQEWINKNHPPRKTHDSQQG